MLLFIFYGQSHKMFIIEISVSWRRVHKNLLLEFYVSTYKMKLDITVAIKNVSSQYEILFSYPFSSFCMIRFLKVISIITHFLLPAGDVSVQASLLLWNPEIYRHPH